MMRLNLKQLLIAIAVGAVFAVLQAKVPAPLHLHADSASAVCAPAATNRC